MSPRPGEGPDPPNRHQAITTLAGVTAAVVTRPLVPEHGVKTSAGEARWP